MSYCRYCGAETNPDLERFCKYCGNPLSPVEGEGIASAAGHEAKPAPSPTRAEAGTPLTVESFVAYNEADHVRDLNETAAASQAEALRYYATQLAKYSAFGLVGIVIAACLFQGGDVGNGQTGVPFMFLVMGFLAPFGLSLVLRYVGRIIVIFPGWVGIALLVFAASLVVVISAPLGAGYLVYLIYKTAEAAYYKSLRQEQAERSMEVSF